MQKKYEYFSCIFFLSRFSWEKKKKKKKTKYKNRTSYTIHDTSQPIDQPNQPTSITRKQFHFISFIHFFHCVIQNYFSVVFPLLFFSLLLLLLLLFNLYFSFSKMKKSWRRLVFLLSCSFVIFGSRFGFSLKTTMTVTTINNNSKITNSIPFKIHSWLNPEKLFVVFFIRFHLIDNFFFTCYSSFQNHFVKFFFK